MDRRREDQYGELNRNSPVKFIAVGTLGLWALIALIALAALSGCATKETQINVQASTTLVCPEPPPVDIITTRPTPPEVIIDGDGLPWVGFAPRAYEDLATNIQAMLRAIKQHQSRSTYYQRCIEITKESIRDDPGS